MNKNEFLAHYTDANGLLGILNSSAPSLWATNIQFLNDQQEYLHTINNAFHKLEEHNRHDISLKNLLTLNLDPLIGFRDLPDNTFTVSFSKKGNKQLSQWRTYSGGSGFCIEFDEKELLELQSNHNTSLEKFSTDNFANFIQESNPEVTRQIIDCRYTNPDSDQEIDKIISNFRQQSEASPNETATRFIEEILHLATHTKHTSFKEESERRIILKPLNPTLGNKLVEFRQRKGILTPYIKFKFPLKAIKRITIGPSPESTLARKGLERLICKLRNEQLPHHCDLEIEEADIPLRF